MPGNGSEKGAMWEPDQKGPWLGFIYLSRLNQSTDHIYICWGCHNFLEQMNIPQNPVQPTKRQCLYHVRKPDPIYVTCLTGTGSDILCWQI